MLAPVVKERLFTVRDLRVFRSSVVAVFLVALTLNPIAAQEPTQAQRDAIRSSCRSDFIAKCSGVQPGGKDAFACLLRNEAKLSAPCRTAVNAAVPKTEAPAATVLAAPEAKAPTAAEPTAAPPGNAATQEDQIKAVREACTLNDFMSHCSWIAPSSPEVLLCLKANVTALSPPCQTVLQSVPAAAMPAPTEAPSAEPTGREPAPPKKPMQAKRSSAPTPSKPASMAAALKKPTAQQTSAVRAACRSDFMSHCSAVQPGGAEALQCLQRNAAQLSTPCKSAVAAIGGGTSAAASETPATATAAPAVAPLGPMPPMRPREAITILKLCRTDQQMLCPGIPLGGGRVISCLAENASRLSPGCYAALARARR